MKTLVLASQSPYKAQLLGKITPSFQQLKPNYKELMGSRESPAEAAMRLAKGKAAALATQNDLINPKNSMILGADQVCYLPNPDANKPKYLHKPGNLDKAVTSLMHCSGNTVHYHSAACLLDGDTGELWTIADEFKLDFRHFTREEATAYCKLEQPWDCAGAIKTESFGINLIKAYRGSDPSTLIGLPLIKLREILVELGFPVHGM